MFDINWGVVTWLLDKSARYVKPLIGRGALARDKWVPQLNELFRNEVELFGPYRHEPVIHLDGPLSLSVAQTDYAAKERSRLVTDPNRSNDPNAILSSEPRWADDPVHLHAQYCDYAVVRTLRNESLGTNPRPPVLSANILMICRETREIILHRRAPWSDHLANHLHTLGGAYWPPNVDNREGDRLSLRRTAIREVGEESDAAFSLLESPMVLFREPPTGFIQLAFLGVNISAKEVLNLKPNREGTLDHVSYDELPRRLRHERNWYPTGKAAILAWLALGAPNAGSLVKFGGFKPTQLFTQEVGAIGV